MGVREREPVYIISQGDIGGVGDEIIFMLFNDSRYIIPLRYKLASSPIRPRFAEIVVRLYKPGTVDLLGVHSIYVVLIIFLCYFIQLALTRCLQPRFFNRKLFIFWSLLMPTLSVCAPSKLPCFDFGHPLNIAGVKYVYATFPSKTGIDIKNSRCS